MGHGGDIYGNRVEMDYSVNLNPLGVPEEVACAVREAADRMSVYPDLRQTAVRQAIADMEGVSAEQVIAGSGASELLLAAVRALRSRMAYVPEPAFMGYAHVLEAAGCRTERLCTGASDGFALREEAFSALFDRSGEQDLIVLCDPANPTGLNLDEELLHAVLDQAQRRGIAVLLDESFFLLSDKADCAAEDRIPRLIGTYDCLMIVRSMTKLLAIPGIRAGYAISAQKNIDGIRAQLPEWNLSTIADAAMIAGCGVLAGTDFAARSRALIRTERAYLAEELQRAGLSVWKSAAPYLLLQGPEELYDALLERGILIRECGDFPGLGRGWFRIAVKDHDSNKKLIGELRAVLTGEEKHDI